MEEALLAQLFKLTMPAAAAPISCPVVVEKNAEEWEEDVEDHERRREREGGSLGGSDL